MAGMKSKAMDGIAPAARAPLLLRPLEAFARRWPFLTFFLLILLSNGAGSWFNIAYNQEVIVKPVLTASQRTAFWTVVVPAYNATAYLLALLLIAYFLTPLISCRRDLRLGEPVAPERMEKCRRLLINLPAFGVSLNLAAWLPGGVLFPLGICAVGGQENAPTIWHQFLTSFSISALLTSVQTFFLLEAFLVAVLYPLFFKGARPSDIRGTFRIPLGARILLLWASVAVVPAAALLAVSLNFVPAREQSLEELRRLSLGVFLVSLPSSGFLMWIMGRNILAWVHAHSAATEAITHGNYRVRIEEQRPDEWGTLTDRFNEMAAELEKGRETSEAFGQFVSPEVRDEVLRHYPGMGGEVQVVTVLFADLRGFTRRTAGEPPQQVVDLLNHFFSLSVEAVEEGGGWVNKFLGDGFMALFGAPLVREDHADLAVASARRLLARLEDLNQSKEELRDKPLRMGIGLHTGPALVGCVGASLPGRGGQPRIRREFTAIGETVNVCQRIEKLTKTLGGPVLLSEETRRHLRQPARMAALGEVSLPGCEGEIGVHRLETD